MEYKAEIDLENMTWTGIAKIPEFYFPFKITKWNAFAINKYADLRTYESLYPIDQANLYNNPDL